jgi:SEC-C motif-containing protein
VLEEASRFRREAGRWYYLEGRPTLTRLKPGRNEACPCGSGRKLKQCCGAG